MEVVIKENFNVPVKKEVRVLFQVRADPPGRPGSDEGQEVVSSLDNVGVPWGRGRGARWFNKEVGEIHTHSHRGWCVLPAQ